MPRPSLTQTEIWKPYEAGVSGGTTAPASATIANQLTKDNPNLVWIDQGPGAASPGGTLATSNGGWIYYLALVNALTNTVSNAGIASVTTGNFQVALTLTDSPSQPR
jgi:hypothetical protein